MRCTRRLFSDANLDIHPTFSSSIRCIIMYGCIQLVSETSLSLRSYILVPISTNHYFWVKRDVLYAPHDVLLSTATLVFPTTVEIIPSSTTTNTNPCTFSSDETLSMMSRHGDIMQPRRGILKYSSSRVALERTLNDDDQATRNNSTLYTRTSRLFHWFTVPDSVGTKTAK
ncbi:hypothetical protein BDV95DRAFT_214167 [Massariosphaeria phaeospora]|uniref:Uncharacterized protein n=1 Tax=Massariosphaeria phaeospora TaxID=100035 RepID=A0A7C8M2L4_9PLEO|nr:hypothetical protein BDV95DRAFT_214167 [Massariosphaeria phaeospora]